MKNKIFNKVKSVINHARDGKRLLDLELKVKKLEVENSKLKAQLQQAKNSLSLIAQQAKRSSEEIKLDGKR